MRRRAIGLLAAAVACSVAYAQTAAPEAPAGILGDTADGGPAATSLADYAPPPAPEAPIIPITAEAASLAALRGASLVGAAGGMAMTAWGLGNAAGAIARAEDPASFHRALALAISGTVIAALCATVTGLATGR
ncbi:MAG: hypothetical protein KKA67_00285 [Spirochaetes bacterium]|nr:hypothetical protein [Spirochaetota bacterium]MBU1079931.1 hypothetical protein [Spirochaetota bacterium]